MAAPVDWDDRSVSVYRSFDVLFSDFPVLAIVADVSIPVASDGSCSTLPTLHVLPLEQRSNTRNERISLPARQRTDEEILRRGMFIPRFRHVVENQSIDFQVNQTFRDVLVI